MSAARSSIDSRGIPGWLQATPFALVFLLFFVLPLIFVVIVSFWDYNDYEMMPSFTTRSYTESFRGLPDPTARSLHDPEDLSFDGEILPDRLGG